MINLILTIKSREHGTTGVHGGPVPQHATALVLGVDRGPTVVTCPVQEAIPRQLAVKVRSGLQF